jgi:hypothetical protein
MVMFVFVLWSRLCRVGGVNTGLKSPVKGGYITASLEVVPLTGERSFGTLQG